RRRSRRAPAPCSGPGRPAPRPATSRPDPRQRAGGGVDREPGRDAHRGRQEPAAALEALERDQAVAVVDPLAVVPHRLPVVEGPPRVLAVPPEVFIGPPTPMIPRRPRPVEPPLSERAGLADAAVPVPHPDRAVTDLGAVRPRVGIVGRPALIGD